MTTTSDEPTPAQRAVGHRIRSHRAALRIAAAVDLPAAHESVLDTLVRLDEARECLAAIEEREAAAS